MATINFAAAKIKYAPYCENGLCPTDPRVADTINRAEEYLIDQGKWKGLIRRMAFCHQGGCITLPRNVESVLEMSGPCGEPITLNNQWFEFLPGGTWQLSDVNKWCNIAVDRGEGFPTIYDVTSNPTTPGQLLRVYADLPEAADAQILIQGNDENGNRVQTTSDGALYDGELIDLNNASPQLSTIQWSYIQAVQKPLTNGVVRIYQVNPADPSVNTGLIARYDPSETIPDYRRIYFNGLCNGNSNDSSPHLRRITILAKMKFVPLVQDTDILQVTCSEAMRRICQAFYQQGSENSTLGDYYENKAIQALNAELKQFQAGGKSNPQTRYAGFGSGPISWQMR